MSGLFDRVETVRVPSKVVGPDGEAYCDSCSSLVAKRLVLLGGFEFLTPTAEFGTMWSDNALYCKGCIPSEVQKLLSKRGAR